MECLPCGSMSHKANDLSPTQTTRGFTVWSVRSELPFGWTKETIADRCESALRHLNISQRKLNQSQLAVLFRPTTEFTGGNLNAHAAAQDLGDKVYRIVVYTDTWKTKDWCEDEVLLTLAHELVHIAQYMAGRLSLNTYSRGLKESYIAPQELYRAKVKRVSYYHADVSWMKRPSEKEAECRKFDVVQKAWGMKTRDFTEHELFMRVVPMTIVG